MKRSLSFFLPLTLAVSLFSLEESLVQGSGTTDLPPQSFPKTECPKIYYYGPNYGDFYSQGDLLWWQPYTADALSWVDLRRIATTSGTDSRYYDSFKSLKYGWEPGFRVGLGYRMSNNVTGSQVRPWQIEMNYAQLIVHTEDQVPAQSGTSGANFVLAALVPTLTPSALSFVSGSSVADLSYRQGRMQFSWPIWASQSVIWRLMTGASYAGLHSIWNSLYSTLPIDPTVNGTRGDDSTDLSWKFLGGGLSTATDFHLEIGHGLGIVASGAIDFLVGRVSVKERYREISQTVSDGVPADIVHQDKNYFRTFTKFQPAFSLGAGLDYKHWFIPKALMVYLAVSYEWMLWLNLNQFGKVNERYHASGITPAPTGILMTTPGNIFNTEPSNLGFQGLTARFGLEF